MKKNYPHPLIAREGWAFILICAIVTFVIYHFVDIWLSIPLILLLLFIIQFFRDPKRCIPMAKGLILAPADGRVICIEEAIDVYNNNVNSLKISIFMNVFNVHSNRSPVDGEVKDIQYFKGKFVNADFDKASTENERNALILRTTSGKTITVVQIAGLIARRILCYTTIGEFLNRGQRFGFIRFGSRVDLYLPLDCQVMVTLGQKVKATESIIACFKDA